MSQATIILKRGEGRTIKAGGAWIYDNEIDRIERELDNIGQQIASSKSYWEGDASNTHQQRYNSLQDDIHRTMAHLKQQPVHLLTMANLYNKTEYENRGTAMMLSNNVI